MSTTQDLLTYKGYPLVRNDKIIYFGNSFDPFIVKLTILSTRTVNETEIADKIEIQLLNTNPAIRPRIVKKSERKGMNEAMDIAVIWLERANSKK